MNATVKLASRARHDPAAPVSHAAVRGQTLVDAARDVLTEMSEVAAALLETEQMRDAMLSRIAAVTTFAEIETASRVIDRLAFKPPAVAAQHS